MKVKLDLVIEYEDEEGKPLPTGRYPKVHELLCEAAEHLYDNGLLSGSHDVQIKSCGHAIILLE